MSRRATRPAVFLDRDGVLVADEGNPPTRVEDFRILPGAPEALGRLRSLGYHLVVVTNQTVIARGLLSMDEVEALHRKLAAELLRRETTARIDAFYVCPHHPNADRVEYRIDCDCRKPKPGLLLRAGADLGLDLSSSFMVGDRPSDVCAGLLAGCRTVLIESGRHEDPPIESTVRYEPHELRIDHRLSQLGDLPPLLPALPGNLAEATR